MIVVKIQLESAEDEARLRDLLPSLHGTLLEKEELLNSLNGLEVRKQRQKKALEAMRHLSEQGGATSFGDASEWQRKIRSWDRVLDGRKE